MTRRRAEAPAGQTAPGALRESEIGFQGWIIDLAESLGYFVQYNPDSRKVYRGKRARNTAVGYPDLTLTHPSVPLLIFVEAKLDGRYPTEEQRAWHTALRLAGARVYVWRPRDRPEIQRLLSTAVGRTESDRGRTSPAVG